MPLTFLYVSKEAEMNPTRIPENDDIYSVRNAPIFVGPTKY